MVHSLPVDILEAISGVGDAYHRLILVVGPQRSGKTTAMADVASSKGWPHINVNLRLAEKLMDLTRRQRAVRVAGILDALAGFDRSDVVLLDNIELLFAVELALDPLRLLQSLSRNRTVVAAWSGDCDGESLIYAEPGHPEYRRFHSPQARLVGVTYDEHYPASLGETKR